MARTLCTPPRAFFLVPRADQAQILFQRSRTSNIACADQIRFREPLSGGELRRYPTLIHWFRHAE
jgi:hypothetical protein